MKAFVIYPTYRIVENKALVYLFGRLDNGESFLSITEFKPYFFIKEKNSFAAEKIIKTKLPDLKFEIKKTKLKNFNRDNVVKITLTLPRDVPYVRRLLEEKEITHYEADIRFAYRFLIDKQIKSLMEIHGKYKKGEYLDRIYENPEISSVKKPDSSCLPELKILSIDIETDSKNKQLYCLSLYSKNYKKTLIIDEKLKKYPHTETFDNEKELLLRFKQLVKETDPDIVTGWNVIDFDLNFLQEKFKQHKIPFFLGRADWPCKLRLEKSFFIESKADFCGRVVLDGIALLKSSFIKLEDYKLDTAAKRFLGERKKITKLGDEKYKEIERMYKQDKLKLIEYNLQDAKLVYDILNKSDTLNLSVQRSLLTGMPIDRVSASIASIDYVYLIEARKRSLVLDSYKYTEKTRKIMGGHVRKPKPGLYDYILVLDFKSLYPSIIRTFNIDPASFVEVETKEIKEILTNFDFEKILKEKSEIIEKENLNEKTQKKINEFKKKYTITPNKAVFVNDFGILPDVIQALWEQRDKAKKEKNWLRSNAIKILMNSFYGSLASPNCRFFSPKMANGITSFGQFLIKLTAKKIEEKGYEVIYSDTDSTFIVSHEKNYKEAEKIGIELQNFVNDFYNRFVKKNYYRKSFLELEFEKVYKKFFMPKIRCAEKEIGAKKRYAGVLLDGKHEKIDFVGLEFVRRDWTELAKRFQIELFTKIFKGEDFSKYIFDFVKDIKKGKYDKLLVYRKAIRKGVEEYVKTTPPHVKAARKLKTLESNIIEYIITINGPEPLARLKSSIDYEHYIQKQIKPIADSILVFFDKSFDELISGSKQKNLLHF